MIKRLITFLLVPAGVALLTLYFYLQGGRYVTTENAYVQTNIAMVSAGRAGPVSDVMVRDHQSVHQGDILFRVDLVPFELAIDHARSMLNGKENEIKGIQADYKKHLARLSAAEQELQHASSEFHRVKKLSTNHAVSDEKIAVKKNDLLKAESKKLVIQSDIAATLARLGGDAYGLTSSYPQIQQAKSKLEQAIVDRQRAEVRAGVDGTIAKMELFAGEYVQQGQVVFAIVQTDELWVEANLKETQLTLLKIGQQAVIEIDAFPEIEIEAEVESIAPASGAEFAILPPQNATGNWVKITQRVPVRLRLLNSGTLPKLRAGMSLSVSIDTGYQRSINDLIPAFVGN